MGPGYRARRVPLSASGPLGWLAADQKCTTQKGEETFSVAEVLGDWGDMHVTSESSVCHVATGTRLHIGRLLGSLYCV